MRTKQHSLNFTAISIDFTIFCPSWHVNVIGAIIEKGTSVVSEYCIDWNNSRTASFYPKSILLNFFKSIVLTCRSLRLHVAPIMSDCLFSGFLR